MKYYMVTERRPGGREEAFLAQVMDGSSDLTIVAVYSGDPLEWTKAHVPGKNLTTMNQNDSWLSELGRDLFGVIKKAMRGQEGEVGDLRAIEITEEEAAMILFEGA